MFYSQTWRMFLIYQKIDTYHVSYVEFVSNSSFSAEFNTWYTIKFYRNNNYIECYINDVLFGTLEYPITIINFDEFDINCVSYDNNTRLKVGIANSSASGYDCKLKNLLYEFA